MELIVTSGCGLDVHKETVVACVMGEGIVKETRTYSTMTNDLLQMKEWLKSNTSVKSGEDQNRTLSDVEDSVS